MDLAFTRKKKGFVDVEPARLDHALLRASLAAHRQAQVQDTDRAGYQVTSDEEHLTELLTGGPSWREAAAAQGGCFSRTEAGRRVNDT